MYPCHQQCLTEQGEPNVRRKIQPEVILKYLFSQKGNSAEVKKKEMRVCFHN